MKKYMMDPDKPFEMLRYQIMEDLKKNKTVRVITDNYNDTKNILTQLIRYCGEVDSIDVDEANDSEAVIYNTYAIKNNNRTYIGSYPVWRSDCYDPDMFEADIIYVMTDGNCEDCNSEECLIDSGADIYICVFKSEKYEHLVEDEEGRPKSFYQSWEDKYGTHTRYYASTNPKFVNEMYKEWKFKEGD